MARAIEKNEIIEILRHVYDPDYVERSVIDMGLVTESDIRVENGEIEVIYRLSSPLCPYSAALGVMIKYALEQKLPVPVAVKLSHEHKQTEQVAEILSSEKEFAELVRKLEKSGILWRCIRF
ncbi:MAG: DUF59 domain-containing protein [Chloroflexi bacterium]|nr:DUF59 domain-containing protein [Chloroflexota bacterium]